MKYGIFILLAAMLFGAITSDTQAYVTTGQTAERLGNSQQYALYTVSFQLGSPKYDYEVPVVATRNLLHSVPVAAANQVGYTLEDKDRLVSDTGTTTAFVVANAPIVDGMYQVPAGSAERFTLVVLMNTDKTTEANKYRLQVTSLPFTATTEDGKEIQMQLNPSELQYYRTAQLGMNLPE